MKDTLEIRERVGKMIQSLRMRKGLTVEQASELSGFSISHIERIERGAYSLRVDVCMVLVEALGGKLIITE